MLDDVRADEDQSRRFVTKELSAVWKAVLISPCLAVIFTFATLAILLPDPPKSSHKYSNVDDQEAQKHSDWGPDGWTALFTGILMLIGAGQAILFFWQLNLIRKSSADAEKAATAAMISANAATRQAELTDRALIAANRPWIMQDELDHNTSEWFSETEELIAQFRIRNHGNTPAFITSVYGMFFHGVTDVDKQDLAGATLPSDYRDFPSPSTFRNFLNAWNKGAWTNNCKMGGGSDHARGNCHPITFGTPITVPVGCVSQRFIIRQWPERARIYPSDLTVRIFLMGIIRYHGPDGEPWVNTFCYVRGAGRLLHQIYGAPYNEKKIEADPMY